METKAQFDTLTETLQEAKGKTALDPLGDTKAEAIKEMLANTLAEAKCNTLDNIFGDVEANAQINTLAGTKMWRTKHFSGCWLTPQQMQGRTKLVAHWAILRSKLYLTG